MRVHATLVDTSLLVYQRYFGRLDAAEKQRYYRDQMLMGEKFGVPREVQPQTIEAFDEYFAAMLASDRLAVTAAMRDVVDATLRPAAPVRGQAAGCGAQSGHRQHAAGATARPSWVCPGPMGAAAPLRSRTLLRRALPLLPGLLRDLPPARSADKRVAATA